MKPTIKIVYSTEEIEENEIYIDYEKIKELINKGDDIDVIDVIIFR